LILSDEIDERGLSVRELAKQLEVPARWLREIVAGRRDVSADMASRLGKFFGTSTEFWSNLQSHYELDRTRQLTGNPNAAGAIK
jgi:addiction module HigA family antidote